MDDEKSTNTTHELVVDTTRFISQVTYVQRCSCSLLLFVFWHKRRLLLAAGLTSGHGQWFGNIEYSTTIDKSVESLGGGSNNPRQLF